MRKNIIWKIIFLLINLIILYILSLIKSPSINHNNSKQLLLNTNINNNQGYHPKVIYFDKLWNGYKYWMAFTPYPNGDETKENPVINVSNDLINWFNPKGIKNPLDVPTISDENHYNSDTHLLFNKRANELEVFWRYVNLKDNEVTIYIKKSKDGINWSEKEIFIKSNDRKKQDYVSPSIIFDKGVYKIWYVHRKKIFYFEKKGVNNSTPRVLKINYSNDYHTWHIDIIYNDIKKLYELITCAYIDVNFRNTMPLFYLYSVDNIVWSRPIKILEPSKKRLKFDSEGLYRSSLIYLNNKYYLFYSAHDIKRNAGIGLMYGTNISNLKPFI